MVDFSLIFIIFFLNVGVACSITNKIFWIIEELPIVYGQNVTIFCNTSAIIEYRATWMKESDVIMHHSFSFYPSKYIEKTIIGGSILTILNTDNTDFNISYTCLCGVFSYTRSLQLNSTNYTVLPIKRDINVRWNLSTEISAEVNIANTFPIPVCKLKLDDQFIPTEQNTHFTEMNRHSITFYNISISCKNKEQNYSGERVNILCFLADKHLIVNETKMLTKPDVNNTSVEYQIFFWATISLCVPLCVLFLYIFIRRRSNPFQSKSQTVSGLEETSFIEDINSRSQFNVVQWIFDES